MTEVVHPRELQQDVQAAHKGARCSRPLVCVDGHWESGGKARRSQQNEGQGVIRQWYAFLIVY
jgi:hypothetical protein